MHNEPAAGYKIHVIHLLMMLARFVLQDCSQTSSQHMSLAVTPTCDHQHSQCAVLRTNELAAGVQNHVIHL
jgi:hypothetical protein